MPKKNIQSNMSINKQQLDSLHRIEGLLDSNSSTQITNNGVNKHIEELAVQDRLLQTAQVLEERVLIKDDEKSLKLDEQISQTFPPNNKSA